MSLARDPSVRHLDDCGCCGEQRLVTPAAVTNRAGLASLAYRAGTHSGFKATMLARLSSADHPALAALRTREDADFTVALLDAFAVVGDVLTFYTERTAGESYLRTATEPVSVQQQARLIGYGRRPGVAASAYLAFEVEDAAGGPAEVTVPAGTRVQSLPGPGQLPQTFETSAELLARPEWNALRPRLGQPQALSVGMDRLLLAGVATGLAPGDRVLIVAGTAVGDRVVKPVLEVAADAASDTTEALLDLEPAPLPRFVLPSLPIAVFVPFSTSFAPLTSGYLGTSVRGTSWNQATFQTQIAVNSWPLPSVAAGLAFELRRPVALPETGVFAFRRKAALFGHNAPKHSTTVFGSPSWEGRTIAGETRPAKSVDLDTTYEEVVPGGWLVLQSGPGGAKVYRVLAVEELSRADYALSAKVTRVHLDHDDGFSVFTLRDTTAYVQSEPLGLVDLPITDAVAGGQLMLDGPRLGLEPGRRVVVTGELTDLAGVTGSELCELLEVELLDGYTVLSFARDLAASYVRGTVTVNANVAAASHGEGTAEVLGSGDATVAFQRFKLAKPPLTHVGAASGTGTASTLEVVVSGVRWLEVPSFHGHGPDERIYVTRLDEHGDTWVTFGDGRTGARLPTGTENVVAAYRSGIGLPGLVAAGGLSLLQSPPAGIRACRNPLPAGGAADAEALEEIRANATLQILTLGRIVSLRDYEDFARAFAGIAKARATWMWTGDGKGVLVTVAGPDGAVVPEGSDLQRNLSEAMLAAGDARVPLRVQSYRPAFFLAAANLTVAPDAVAEQVLAGVQDALRAAFAFATREFGQPVSASEVVEVVHRVAGVEAVVLTALHRVGATVTVEETLAADAPAPGTTDPLPPELLLLDPRPVELRAL